jgi:VCBS repeat-containing protein
MTNRARIGRALAGLFTSVLLSAVAPNAAVAIQALPVTVTSSTNWSVATSLPPAGATTFTYGTKPLVPIMGDWDGDGDRTPGTFEAGVFRLSNTLPPGAPTINVAFGDPRGFPVVGDLNGDTFDDVAVYRNGTWQIRIELGGIGSGGSVGTPAAFTYGTASWPTTVPVAGDWDGVAGDGIGFYTYATGVWQLRQTAEPLGMDLPAFTYWAGSGTASYPVVGDWDADGDDTAGVKAASSWLLNNQNNGISDGPGPGDASAGPQDMTFTFGLANDLPLVGGSTAGVPPTAVGDSATVAEDASATAVAVLTNDSGGPATIASASDPANGTVVLTGGSPGAHTGLTYQPDPNYCNSPPGTSPDTFSYTLNGGSSATVFMTVTCVDDAPVAVNDSATVVEDSSASAVDVLANDTDIDGGPKAVSSVTQPANASVVITGGGTGVSYTPNADYCNSSGGAPDTFTYTLTPDGSTATVSVTVTCGASALPTAVDDSATVAEDASATAVPVLTNDTGGPATIASASDPANGTVVLTGGTPGAHTGLTYQPDPNYCNSPPGTPPDTFTYTLNGGSSATVFMTVTCGADNPVVDASAGSLAYTENDAPTAIDPGVTVSDADGGASIAGAKVAITTNFAAGQDLLALSGMHPGISALFAGNTLSLTGTATPAAYQAALRAVTYANTSEGPSTLARTVTFTVTDDTALSGSDTRGITVAGVNDPPTAVDDTRTTDEDTPLAVAAPGVLANDTDVDPGDTKTVVALNGSGTLTGATAEGGSVTINANGSYTYTPPSAFQAMSTGQSDTDSFGYTMRDAAGAQSTATVNLTVNGVSDAPTAVADTFDAVGNTGLFVGTTRPAGDAGKVITGSILTNDTDPDSPPASLVAEAVTNAPTALGGTITIEADGNFTYHPDDGDTGATDTFTYRVCDSSPSPCSSGTVANSTGTINLVLSDQVWYVRNNQVAGGDGTSDTPFDTLLEAETASGTGDTVYVFDGANTTTNLDTGYVMAANERLIGESRPLSLDPDGGGPLLTVNLHPGTSGAQPTLTASSEDVVVLASNVLVDGVDVDPSGTGGGLSGGAGTGDVTVQNVNVTDTGTAGTQPGIEMEATTGVNRFTGVTVSNGGSATAIGVRINNADRVQFTNTATNTIATTGAKALDAAATNLLNSRWNEITVTGSGTGAIRLNNTTGSPALGDGAGTDLALQTTSGATAALDIASSNNVTVDTNGTDTISATGGPAVDIRNSNGSRYFFDSVSSTNSAGDGINLNTNLATPFLGSAGSIGGAAGIAVDIEGGGAVAPANVIYNGAINDGPGQSVEVTGRDGGEVSIGSTIADSADAGGGIVVSGNTAGKTAFLSASEVLNTGASDAVALSSNGSPTTGHTVSFLNGGLDIRTTSGRGLSASGGGVVEVTHNANSITTGTGTALNVDNTGIGPNNVTFASISSNGAPNGIVLANTVNPNGRLVVTGGGGACTSAATCTGGAIRSSTTSGVSLTNVPGGVSLTRMAITGSADDGVRGTGVGGTGFDLDNAWINANGNTPSTGGIHGDHGVDFTALTGTSTFTNSTVSNSADSNVVVEGASGAMTLDVTGGTYSGAGGGMGDSIYVETNGTGAQNLSVQGPITFANNVGSHVQHNGNPTSTADSDVTVNNATMSSPAGGGAVLGGGITVVHGGPTTGGGSNTDVTITNNNIQNSVIGAIVVGTTGSASNQQIANVDATISNNTIGTAGIAGSGSVQGNGIFVDSNGNSNVRALIKDNAIRQWTNRSGIALDAVDGDAGLSATIRGNVLTEPNSASTASSTRGMTLQLGTAQAADSVDVCLDIGDLASAALKNQVFGTGESPQPDVRYLHEGPGSVVQLVGYAGPAVPAIGDIAGWFQPRNNLGGTPTVTGTSTAPIAPASTTTSAASCPQPAS